MKRRRIEPRSEPFDMPQPCACGGSSVRQVTIAVKGSHPMISVRYEWYCQCQKCGHLHQYMPSPADIATAARKVT